MIRGEEFDKIVAEFVGALEHIFHYDYAYSQLIMGWRVPTISQQEYDRVQAEIENISGKYALKPEQQVSSEGNKPTFLWPQLTEAEEIEDWGSYGHFLQEYRRLLKAMKERGLEAVPPFPGWSPDKD